MFAAEEQDGDGQGLLRGGVRRLALDSNRLGPGAAQSLAVALADAAALPPSPAVAVAAAVVAGKSGGVDTDSEDEENEDSGEMQLQEEQDSSGAKISTSALALRRLSLAANPGIGDTGITMLAPAVLGERPTVARCGCQVSWLDVSACGLESTSGVVLAAAILNRPFELLIAKNKLGKRGKDALGQALPDSKYGHRKAAADATKVALLLAETERKAAAAAAKLQKQEAAEAAKAAAKAAAEEAAAAAKAAKAARKAELMASTRAKTMGLGKALAEAKQTELKQTVSLAAKVHKVDAALAALDEMDAEAEAEAQEDGHVAQPADTNEKKAKKDKKKKKKSFYKKKSLPKNDSDVAGDAAAAKVAAATHHVPIAMAAAKLEALAQAVQDVQRLAVQGKRGPEGEALVARAKARLAAAQVRLRCML